MMSADELLEWRTTLGIPQRGAAAALYVTEQQIRAFEDWSEVIPDSIEDECALLLAEMEAQAPPRDIRQRTDMLRATIFALFPDFEGHFDDAMALGVARLFTPHGLLSEFSSYYLHQVTDFASPQMATFFQHIEAIYAADRHDADNIANAIATCFLENISSTQAGEAGRPLMGPASTRFFMNWHQPPLA